MLEFVNKNWKKNWDGGWSLLSSAYLGFQYTKQLREELGNSLEETLFVCHKSLTACYFVDSFKETFANFLVKKVNEDSDILLTWSKSLKETTDQALTLIEKIKLEPFSKENFELFIEAMYNYGVFHRIIKVIVDYLKPEILEKYLKALEEARVYAEPVYAETENYMRHMALELSVKFKLAPELILAMTKEQFDDFIVNEIVPDISLLQDQYNDGVLYMDQGRFLYIFNKNEVKQVEESLLKQTETSLVKGKKAYPGRVTGIARVILDPKTSNDFKQGEILVTGMTRPEYLAIIEKSAGFVTDAGGILSHAAITARELKKPCVVGTEIATKVLHDGDLVELDADNGVVKILK